MKYIIKGIVYVLYVAILIIWEFIRWLVLVIWTLKLNPKVKDSIHLIIKDILAHSEALHLKKV